MEKTKPFLVTTAIEDFWKPERKLVFLGAWSKLYSRKDYWGKLNSVEVDYIWSDKTKVEEAIQYCSQLYEKALTGLTVKLNEIHHIEKDPQYYRIILGNWLFEFACQLYDKYCHLKKAFGTFPDMETELLEETCFYIPSCFEDYRKVVFSNNADKYALQQYSQIIENLGFDFPKKKITDPIPQRPVYRNTSKNIKEALFLSFQKAAVKISGENSVTLCNVPEIKPFNRIELFLKAKGRIIFDDLKYPVKTSFTPNYSLRKTLYLDLKGDEFENIFSKVIFKNIPIISLEAFKEFRNEVSSFPIKKSSAFFSTNAMVNEDIFKFFTAEDYKNIRILALQHGGGYGLDKFCFIEKYKNSICDKLYTYGWGNEGKNSYLPSPKLISSKVKSNNNTVLFSLDNVPRYIFSFQFSPNSSGMLKYIEDSKIFINALNNNIDLSVRLHSEDYHWSMEDRIKESNKNIKFDKCNNFKNKLNNSSIFVTNYLGTTLLEALTSNKPTICFLNFNIFSISNRGVPFVDLLKKVKIIHDSPDSASRHLNQVYDNPNPWWKNKETQKARLAFCDVFAKTEKKWQQKWLNELKNYYGR